MDVSILHAGHQQPRHRNDLCIRTDQLRHFGAHRNDAFALDGDLRMLRPGREEHPAAHENKICSHRGIR